MEDEKLYRHLFFDLDHTLWDFEKNSEETLREIYQNLDLQSKGVPSPEAFIGRYRFRNEFLWREYRQQNITVNNLRLNRFVSTLSDFNISCRKTAIELSDLYMSLCPGKKNLLPYVNETLLYLKESYTLHIITNGMTDTQLKKIRNSELDQYFDQIITSDLAGSLKPEKAIFDFSLRQVNSSCNECIYIGDNLEIDILGAKNAGLDQVYYNPSKLKHLNQVTFEITCLSEMKEIF